MAAKVDGAMERVAFNTLEGVTSEDLNLVQSGAHESLHAYARSMFATRINSLTDPREVEPEYSLFMGSALYCTAGTGMEVLVAPGVWWAAQNYPGGSGTDVEGYTGANYQLRMYGSFLYTEQSIAVPAADGALDRYDIVEVMLDPAVKDSTTIKQWNPATKKFDSNSAYKSLSTVLNRSAVTINGSGPINYKTGTPGGAAPTVTAGYTQVARVLVPAATASVTQNNIRDDRNIAFPYGAGYLACTIAKTTGSTVATLSNLVAPPGIRAAAVGGANGAVDLYLIAGAAQSGTVLRDSVPIITMESSSTTYLLTLNSVTLNDGTISAGERTTLATASPNLPVAAGQQRYKLSFSCSGAATGSSTINGTTLPTTVTYRIYWPFVP
jgi:hypothetical protein